MHCKRPRFNKMGHPGIGYDVVLQHRWCKQFSNAIIFFTLTENWYQITSFILLHHSSTSPCRNALCHLLAFQPKSKHEGRNLLLLSKSYFFCDISLAKRASIIRVTPVKAVVTCSQKTSPVSQSSDSFGTEAHCRNQNLSQPT